MRCIRSIRSWYGIICIVSLYFTLPLFEYLHMILQMCAENHIRGIYNLPVTLDTNFTIKNSNSYVVKKTLIKEIPQIEDLGQRCSESQVNIIANLKPHKNSACPDNDKWIQVLQNDTASNAEIAIVSVGCNKGDDVVRSIGFWSQNNKFSVWRYRKTSQLFFPKQTKRACPIEKHRPSSLKSNRLHVRAYCIEPMPSNFELLQTVMRDMGYIGPIKLIQAAVSSVSGKSPFPNAEIGKESMGLGMNKNNKYSNVEVDVISLDKFVQNEKLLKIDYLTIDTEGNDMKALIGCIKTLASGIIRYLEFEYHSVGRWARSDLQDLIDILDQLNFDCYWTLNSGNLLRLTGCWHDSYYSERTWSNIGCINRMEINTHLFMQKNAGFM